MMYNKTETVNVVSVTPQHGGGGNNNICFKPDKQGHNVF